MTQESKQSVPASPENQPAEVRKELEQTNVSHEGAEKLQSSTTSTDGEETGTQQYMGASEENVTPVTPPVSGSGEVTQPEDGDDDAGIDPADELTPG